MPTEIEIQWKTYAGTKYQLQESTNLSSWITLPTIYAGDGGMKSVVFPASAAKKFYRLLWFVPEGSEPLTRAETAWDGSRVTLYWNLLGGTTQRYEVWRNGSQIGQANQGTFVDNTVQSGHFYTYLIKFYQ